MSKERVPCKKCGAMILPETAERCVGFCMPCYQRSPESARAVKREYKAWVKKSDFRDILTKQSTDRGSLDPEVREAFEKRYSIELPEDLVQLMSHQNGGSLHDWALKKEGLFDSVFPIVLVPSEEEKLGCMISVYEWLETRGDVEEEPELKDYQQLLERLIVLDTDGHFYTCLDYRTGSKCSGIVSVCPEGGYDGNVQKLGKRFKSFFKVW